MRDLVRYKPHRRGPVTVGDPAARRTEGPREAVRAAVGRGRGACLDDHRARGLGGPRRGLDDHTTVTWMAVGRLEGDDRGSDPVCLAARRL